MDISPWIILAGVAAAIFVATRLRGSRIDSAAARALIAAGGQLVDVRTPAEFTSGHIEGAVNLPLQSLGSRLGELDRSRPVVLYCRSGSRSGMAAGMLRNAGFAEVHNLGPMTAW